MSEWCVAVYNHWLGLIFVVFGEKLTKIVRVTEADCKPILKRDFLEKTEQIRGKKIPLGLLFLNVVLCTTLCSANNRPRAIPSD